MRTPPGIEQWRELYEAARLFREAAPWDALLEDQLFAVESPEIGQTLYCSILGATGGQFGLIAARGARGLLGYVLLTEGELDEDEGSVEQDGLSYLLGDDQLVSDEDREVHRQLGLSFTDESMWPLFLSLTPHYLAVRPDASEAAALTLALDQARAFVESLRSGEEPPEVVEGEKIVGRQQDDAGAWRTSVLKMPPPPPVIRLEVDPVRCAVVLRRGRRSREVWEATMATLGPVDAEGGGETFWARMLLCVDRDSKQVAGGEVLGPDVSPQDALLSAIENGGTIPRTVDLTSGLLESQLKPLADVLKIRLRRVEQLPIADAVRRQMKQALALS